MLRRSLLIIGLLLLPLHATAFDLRLIVPGGSEDLKSDLRSASLTSALKSSGEAVTGQDILAAAQADYARLIGELYADGYFSPVISIRVNGREASSIPAISAPPLVRQVDITVQTGPPFRFGRARIAPTPTFAELPAGFATGEPASTEILREAVDAGIASYRALGHAKAAVSRQTITARHTQQRLDADIRLDPGPRLRFGRLNIRGNQAVRTERVRDIAGLPTGRVFDPDEVDRAATRLRRTGAFSSVSLTEAAEIGAGDTLDISAQVVEAKPRRFGFGAELSTQEGLTVSSFWLHRNLFGGAERFRVEGEISGIGGETGGEDYELGFRFNRPATFNEDTDFYASGRIESLDEPNFKSDHVALEAGIRRYARPEREYTFGIGFEAAKTEDAFGTRNFRVLTFPLGAKFDYRDNALNPKSGYFARASVTPFVGISGTDDGVRTYLDARAYYSTGRDDRLTFAVRGQVGSVSGPSLANAPTDFLFYSGGGGTVRGHEYQSLGVELPSGDVIGGRAFLGLSTEIRVQTSERLSVVGFFDAGYIGQERFPDGSSGRWHTGAGAGLRYNTGIGPVRLDLAVPLTGPGDPSGFEIYIGIGQAF